MNYLNVWYKNAQTKNIGALTTTHKGKTLSYTMENFNKKTTTQHNAVNQILQLNIRKEIYWLPKIVSYHNVEINVWTSCTF